MLALDFTSYNFAHVHLTIRVTPAMEVDIADQVWSIEEIVALRDDRVESVQKARHAPAGRLCQRHCC
jgi:hypothetical protein